MPLSSKQETQVLEHVKPTLVNLAETAKEQQAFARAIGNDASFNPDKPSFATIDVTKLRGENLTRYTDLNTRKETLDKTLNELLPTAIEKAKAQGSQDRYVGNFEGLIVQKSGKNVLSEVGNNLADSLANKAALAGTDPTINDPDVTKIRAALALKEAQTALTTSKGASDTLLVPDLRPARSQTR